MSKVCTCPDGYIQELELDKGLALWRARLSNGEIVVQDDNRPGVSPHSAWLRLAEYVEKNDLDIEMVWLSFRGNNQEGNMPEKADGYFFVAASLGLFNVGTTLQFSLLGYLQNDKLVVHKWQVPELTLVEVEEREVKLAGKCLILNKRLRNATNVGGPPNGPGVSA